MNFLSIPEEVIEGSLLPFLKWNDLLRFRRGCKVTKEITQGFMKVHPELAPEIEIGEDERSFGAFLKMNIPTNRIFLNNLSGAGFYEKDVKNIAKFLEKYGPLVKHLRVKQFSLYSDGTFHFMEGLVNLHSFEAEHFGLGTNAFRPEQVLNVVMDTNNFRGSDDFRVLWKVIPNIFKQLKVLRIEQQNCFLIGSDVSSCTGRFLEIGRGLEHATFPFKSNGGVDEGYDTHHALSFVFKLISTVIKERGTKYPDTPNLKTFSFCCYKIEEGLEAAQMRWVNFGAFLELLRNCIKYEVQLKNVDSLWFNWLAHRHGIPSPDMGIPILSLVNLHQSILPLNMPQLEKVEIRATSRSSPGQGWMQQRPEWPALKCVDITVDCKQITGARWENGRLREAFYQDVKVIFQLFFLNVRRTNLTEIRLNFTAEPGQVSVPKTEDIVASCPNLKKITLIKWPGTNKALTKLWGGLSALEEISLEDCKELGNVAFVGQDAKNPVFFKLKKLRKLSLKGLDQMPKITDTLFSLVLRHLNLAHLILTSDRLVKSVTSTGILCLLEGSFAQKIEKFPFQHWSLEGVPPEEFKKMEVQFRSNKML